MPHREIFLSVVVPAYNEESRLEAPLPHVVDYYNSNFERWELIYVNDGSSDNTLLKLNQIQTRYPVVKIVNNSKNEGKGSAVSLGMRAAKGDFILFSDTDFSTPVEETEKLLMKMDEGYDIVIASRGMEDSQVEIHQNWMREEMGKVFNMVLRSLLPLDFQDTQCGFKMFRRKAMEIILARLSINGFAFDVEMLAIGQMHSLAIAEVPVIWRNVRESKVHPFRNSLEMLKDLLRIRYKLLMNHYA